MAVLFQLRGRVGRVKPADRRTSCPGDNDDVYAEDVVEDGDDDTDVSEDPEDMSIAWMVMRATGTSGALDQAGSVLVLTLHSQQNMFGVDQCWLWTRAGGTGSVADQCMVHRAGGLACQGLEV